MQQNKKKMIRFKQKEYTIQEGHYTGPKDLEKVPGIVEVVGKATLGGTAIGGTVGGVLKAAGVEGASISESMETGGKTGFITGLIAKFLLNALHKPMKTVKFQEVDKILRAKFGIYRVSGFTTGDTLAKRKTVEEKFGFNDRNVTSYKLSFCIRDNQVTMYTLGLSEEDMNKLNSSLDYYCKKFTGMSYSSKPINARTNTYSVSITFTNYKAIADFIFELSEVMGYKINLLNDNALLETRLGTEEERSYSLSKYDKIRIWAKSGIASLAGLLSSGSPKAAWSLLVSTAVYEGLKEMSKQESAKYFPTAAKHLSTSFLEDRMKRLGWIEGMHYTVGQKNCEVNMNIDQGIFLLTTLTNPKLNKIMGNEGKSEVKGKVTLWTLPIRDRNEFDILLKKIMSTGVKPNIFK